MKNKHITLINYQNTLCILRIVERRSEDFGRYWRETFVIFALLLND